MVIINGELWSIQRYVKDGFMIRRWLVWADNQWGPLGLCISFSWIANAQPAEFHCPD